MAAAADANNINGYLIIQTIGSGVFGNIYRVSKCNEIFAMKELENFQAAPVNEHGQLTEIANLTELTGNLNVLRLVESFSELAKLYIVTEYCEHGDLKRVINSGDPMLANERFVAIVMTQLCRGVRFIHSNDVLHNDITIVNIFVQSGGVIKIGDFGLSEDLTHAMVPEGDISLFQSDIYGVGTVLSFLARRHLDETEAVTSYLRTLTERIRCYYPSQRPKAAEVHQLFCKIERKLNSSAEDLEAGPAGGGDGIVSIIINNRDNLIIENEGGDNVNHNVDDGDNDLNNLVEDYLPW